MDGNKLIAPINCLKHIVTVALLLVPTFVYAANEHPAVCRIIVDEQMGHAYGSGTLIDARKDYGLVITNWHVVRDANGLITVRFPNGFESEAKPVKLDETWDLAALVIWRPPTEPVRLASTAPKSGDLLTIHGYGQGRYRQAWGRCTSYYAPEVGMPKELVELDVEARQGDSSGPIFNSQGELAGVLFGAGQGTTLGSFGGRVDQFLATLGDGIGKGTASNLVIASQPSSKDINAQIPPSSKYLSQNQKEHVAIDPFLAADIAAAQKNKLINSNPQLTNSNPSRHQLPGWSSAPIEKAETREQPLQVAAVPRATKPTAVHTIDSTKAVKPEVPLAPQIVNQIKTQKIASAKAESGSQIKGIDLKQEGQTILALFGIIAIVVGGLRGLTS